jgi:hypothetical protein
VADQFASQALQKQVVPLTHDMAFSAALLGTEHQLAMADAMITPRRGITKPN